MTKEESMAFGAKLKKAWDGMTEDQQVEFILNLPYRTVLNFAAITRKGQEVDLKGPQKGV